MPSPPANAAPALVVLTGNPNSGKTTLFNALTGLRAKVGNYAGVTVERKEGRLQHTPKNFAVTVLDLPGTYSLSPQRSTNRLRATCCFTGWRKSRRRISWSWWWTPRISSAISTSPRR